jgi:hypothetical protein
VKLLIRIIGLALLMAFAAAWVWACVAGLGLGVNIGGAVLIAATIAWLRQIWLLQIAAFLGALLVWRWPFLLALLLAAPRALLVLPGLVSTYLANRRHPRTPWPSVHSSITSHASH